MATSTVLGFRGFRPAQLHSYKGNPNIHSSSYFLLQGTLSTESKEQERFKEGFVKGAPGGSVGLCQAAELHKSPSAWSWGKHSRSPALPATPNTSQRRLCLAQL